MGEARSELRGLPVQGDPVHVQVWADSSEVAALALRVVDRPFSGVDLELGGLFGSGFGFSVGEAPAWVEREQSWVPGGAVYTVRSCVGEINGDVDFASLRAAVEGVGAFLVLDVSGARGVAIPSTYADFAAEAPERVLEGARAVASGVGEVVGNALGGAVESFGVGKAVLLVGAVAGAAAFAVFGLPGLVRAVRGG